MNAPSFTRRPSRIEWLLFIIRLATLTLCVSTFMPPVYAYQNRDAEQDQRLAVTDERVKRLEDMGKKTDAAIEVVIAQHMVMGERVSRIEGIGIGLGLLTGAQLILQVANTISIKKKER